MLKLALSPANLQGNYKRAHSRDSTIARARDTSLYEANGDVPLDGVDFHDWVDYSKHPHIRT